MHFRVESGAEKIKKMLSIAIDETSKYSTPVIYPGAYPEKTSKVGSGTYVIISGKKGILTNWHVADHFEEAKAKRISVPFTNYEHKELAYECIVKLHPLNIQNDYYPDLAFIVFRNSASFEWVEIMNSLNKQFINLDEAKQEYNNDPSSYNLNREIHIIHGSIFEGKGMINNRKTIFFPKAGPHIVVPSNFQKTFLKHPLLGNVEIDTIDCYVKVEDRKALAKNFFGMSGAALWSIVFDKDSYIAKIKLLGVATMQSKTEDKIICQGPIALYETFYPMCFKIIKLSEFQIS